MVKWQMKAHLFDRSNPISIIGFLETFNLACAANRIHDKTAMSVLPFFVKCTLSATLNSCMSAATNIISLVALVNTVKPTTQKIPLCSYSEVLN